MAAAANRKQFDWEAIEKEYRAGQLSIREIGRQLGPAAQTIIDRAKRKGWTRDLSSKVKQSIKAKLIKADTDTSTDKKADKGVSVDKDNATSEKDIIDTASDRGVSVILLQRQDINKLKKEEQRILDDLGDNPTKLYLAQYQGKIIKKTVGLTVSEQASALQALANVQHKRIALERQAFGLDDDKGEGVNDSLEEILKSVAGATRGLPNKRHNTQIED